MRVRIRRFIKKYAVLDTKLRWTFLRLALGTARHSAQPQEASLPSSVQQLPYPGLSVFFAHPQAAQSTRPFLMFGPSLRDGSGTMASADSCSLNDTSRSRLPFPAW